MLEEYGIVYSPRYNRFALESRSLVALVGSICNYYDAHITNDCVCDETGIRSIQAMFRLGLYPWWRHI